VRASSSQEGGTALKRKNKTVDERAGGSDCYAQGGWDFGEKKGVGWGW
jgi:hypothetical protein